MELKSITVHSIAHTDNAGQHGQGLKREDLQKNTKKILVKFNQIKKRRREIRHRSANPNSGKTYMFGVKCNFGTDDFFFLSLFCIALRTAW